MGFTLDNQTLLYIVIAFFIVQFLIMRYYVNSTVEDNTHKNNKKIVKKMASHIGATFEEYMGRTKGREEEVDSVDDPAEEEENHEEETEDQ